MGLEPARLSKIIFGPVGICDENRGDQIFQPLSHDRPELDESSCVLVTDVVAKALKGAACGDEEDAGLWR
jgi:hypothetical protein